MPEPSEVIRARAILAPLERHGVRNVLIGGIAAVARGVRLLTDDVDITPAADIDISIDSPLSTARVRCAMTSSNRREVEAALAEGIRLRGECPGAILLIVERV